MQPSDPNLNQNPQTPAEHPQQVGEPPEPQQSPQNLATPIQQPQQTVQPQEPQAVVMRGPGQQAGDNVVWYKKKSTIMIFSIVATVVLIIASALFVRAQNSTKIVADIVISRPVQESAKLLEADGDVQISQDGKTWSGASVGDVIEATYSVRTATNSRAVIILSDASEIRLDNKTTMQLAVSESNHVEVSLVNGQVYSRITETQGRLFAVVTERERFESLGTAYKTSTNGTTDIVEVFQSSVKVESADIIVEQGNAYDTSSKEVAGVDLLATKDDEFIQWNKNKDASNDLFKDKLGILQIQLGAGVEDIDLNENSSTAMIALTGQVIDKGINLSWTTSNVRDGDGYKIVRSELDSMPTYKVGTSVYISNKEDKSYILGLDDGKTYFVRLCIYRAIDASCDTYSNSIQVTAPFAPAQAVVEGKVTAVIDNNKLSWTFNGSAPYGFKIVMSSDVNSPVYPANKIGDVSPGKLSYELPTNKPPAAYYVRVCKHTGKNTINNGCTDYSNTVNYIIK